MKKEVSKFDVIIVGAGPVGLSTSIALSQKGFKVAVVDKIDLVDVLKADFDGRTTALSYGTKCLMADWGVWPLIEKESTPILSIATTANEAKGMMHYGPEESDHRPMGFIIENYKLRAGLIREAIETYQVRMFAPHEIESHEKTPFGYEVTLDGGEVLQAPLVVAADGKRSTLRGWVSLEPKELPYKQIALVFVVEHSKSHQGQAFEHFRSTGPLAFLPMQGNRSSVVWSLEEDLSKHMQNLSPQDFEEELTRAFGTGLGDLHLASKIWSYPLSAMVLREYTQDRLLFLGDAAHTIHPVAGQGFNVGVRDVACLAKHLFDAKSLGLDWGSDTILKAYERDRKIDVHTMTGFTDLLVRFFSNHSRTPQYIGGKGLNLINRMPPLKKVLTRHAMGLSPLKSEKERSL